MDHKNLDVWQAGIQLAEEIYKVSSHFPKEELYGLTSQLRRSAISIPSNIAEGAARSGDREFIQFLYIALGSLAELETQLIIANRIGYCASLTELNDRMLSIKQMLLGLLKHLKRKPRNDKKAVNRE